MADALAGFFADEDESPAGAAAEAAFAGAWRIDHFSRARKHFARFVVSAAIASEIARIVIHDLVGGVSTRKMVLGAGHGFAVMLDLGGEAKLFPVSRDRSHAVRADGDDLCHVGLLEGFEVLFRKLLED